jgi:hypothetical protein
MLQDYLPKTQNPISLKSLRRFLIEEIKDAADTLHCLVRFYEPIPREPDKQYPNVPSAFSEQQRRQCLEMFERSERRIDKLEAKASTLSQTVNLLAPLFLAATAYLWSHLSSLSKAELCFLILVTLIGMVCLFGAIIASFRANDLKVLQVPGLASIIDPNKDEIIKYEPLNDGYCLVYCAMMNEKTSDLRVKFLKAGNLLVLLALILLLILAFDSIKVTVSESQISRPSYEQALIDTSKTLAQSNMEVRHALDIISKQSSETTLQIDNLTRFIESYQKENQERKQQIKKGNIRRKSQAEK